MPFTTTPHIGVFDSGFGGLTVLRALLPLIPNAHYIYLGDTARLPYGSKSRETIARYAVSSAKFLHDQGAELLVIACNTATALALDRYPARSVPSRSSASSNPALGRQLHRRQSQNTRPAQRIRTARTISQQSSSSPPPPPSSPTPTPAPSTPSTSKSTKRPAPSSSLSSKKAGSTTPSPTKSSAST